MDSPRFARFQPAPVLALYVECYWMLQLPIGQALPLQRMPADGRIEIMFNFGAGSRRMAADGSDLCVVDSACFVLGARGQGYTLEHSGAPRYIAIRFKPGGLSAFARVPLAELTDIYLDLDNLWDGRMVREITDQLEAAATPKAQALILNAVLLARLHPPDHLPRLLYAVNQLQTPQFEMTMPMLADEISVSQKHFERLFARYIGFRPSLFARIVRFQQAMYSAMTQPKALTLGQLALAAGYYDQAHFTKDFKHFSGITPNSFFGTTHQFVRITTPSRVVDLLQDPQAQLE